MGANDVTPTFEVDGGVDFTVAGIINDNTDSSAIIKTGDGALILGGDNVYDGTTTVSAGKLLVNGTQSGNGERTVAGGATLGGSGTCPNNVTL